MLIFGFRNLVRFYRYQLAGYAPLVAAALVRAVKEGTVGEGRGWERGWDSPGFFSIHSLISAALFYDREPYFDEILPRNMKSEKYPQTLSL